ncbi:MAG: FKBP-type peptidyl-prolyl cis-trans isomerase SlyD [Bradymonadia bacterium]
MTDSAPTVANNHVVFMHYVLKDADGNVIDASGDGEPMVYLHGASNIVPGLEKHLEGKAVGDKIDAVVAPEEAYGPAGVEESVAVGRDQFPKEAVLEIGEQFGAQDDDGTEFAIWVADVDETQVWVTQEHPLAGVELHFNVEIVDVRAATVSELEHGHAHGPGGHHH